MFLWIIFYDSGFCTGTYKLAEQKEMERHVSANFTDNVSFYNKNWPSAIKFLRDILLMRLIRPIVMSWQNGLFTLPDQ